MTTDLLWAAALVLLFVYSEWRFWRREAAAKKERLSLQAAVLMQQGSAISPLMLMQPDANPYAAMTDVAEKRREPSPVAGL